MADKKEKTNRRWFNPKFWFLMTRRTKILMGALKITIVFLIVIGVGLFLCFKPLSLKITGISLLAGNVIWLTLWINILGPTEMAIKVLFGEPDSFCDSGIRLVPYLPGLKCYLAKYPKRTYNLNYPECEVISKAGLYGDPPVMYGALPLKVWAVVYLNFPREPVAGFDDTTYPLDHPLAHPLIKILRAGIPIDEEGLKKWTDDAVMGALRVALGQMTWKQAIEDMKLINKEVGKVFKDTDGALIKAGFREKEREKGIKLVVVKIEPPKEIKDALSQPDKARLAADAAQNVAKKNAVEITGTLIKMLSENTGMPSEEIQKEIKESPSDFIKTYGQLITKNLDLLRRQMSLSKNALVDIHVDGAKGGEKTFLNLLAAWQKMSQGSGKRTKEGKEKEVDEEEISGEEPSGEKKYLTSEEKDEIYKKTMGGEKE